MSLTELLNQVESIDFAVQYTILSGFSIFRRALENDETVQRLIELLHWSNDDMVLVFKRLQYLLNANDQPEYAHPYDPAISAYLYALSVVDHNLSVSAAQQVLLTRQLFWAHWLAKQILETLRTGTMQYQIPSKIQPRMTLISDTRSVSTNKLTPYEPATTQGWTTFQSLGTATAAAGAVPEQSEGEANYMADEAKILLLQEIA